MLEVKDIALTYEKAILQQITFAVENGEIIGIAGTSGAGKTSLLKILGGLLDASSGEVFLDGKRVVGPAMRLIPGHPEIQLVNQDFALDLYQTAEENIRGKILHLPYAMQEDFIDELLELLELTAVRKRSINLLSGGEQQRVAIARALAMEPQVLLLDEPFVHLDAQLRIRLINYLVELGKVRTMSIIIVSHNSEELLSICNRILFLENGKISRIASPREFYYNYKTIQEGRIFGYVNQIQFEGEVIYFRPDEFIISDKEAESLVVKFLQASFMGGYYLNEFLLQSDKKIVLLHKEPLNYVRAIQIKKNKA